MPSGDTASPGCCTTPSGDPACSATLSMTIVGSTLNGATERRKASSSSFRAPRGRACSNGVGPASSRTSRSLQEKCRGRGLGKTPYLALRRHRLLGNPDTARRRARRPGHDLLRRHKAQRRHRLPGLLHNPERRSRLLGHFLYDDRRRRSQRSNRAQEGLFLVVSRSAGKGLLERCRAFLFQNVALARDGGQDAHSVTHAAALLHPIFMVDRERLRKPLRAS